VGTLASVLEKAGFATVALSSIRGQIETTTPPRALHCNFPLGRPLGKPNEPEFQRKVITAAFSLLAEPVGPVLVDYPISIQDDADTPLSCPIPPADTSGRNPAAAEALGLHPAWRRTQDNYGRSTVGKVITAEQVPDMLDLFTRIAEGEPWEDVGFPGDPTKIAADIKNFYEEAAISLADTPPSARSAESWFVTETLGGQTIQTARIKMKEADVNFYFWYYLLPMTQHHEIDTN
tara:strand:+ start:28 stop:729 length:702 start_codon:yes stop_codon:yes gene_type:complete